MCLCCSLSNLQLDRIVFRQHLRFPLFLSIPHCADILPAHCVIVHLALSHQQGSGHGILRSHRVDGLGLIRIHVWHGGTLRPQVHHHLDHRARCLWCPGHRAQDHFQSVLVGWCVVGRIDQHGIACTYLSYNIHAFQII
jgi:hypothetical protein